jgi:hypothetical protein
MRRVRAGQDIAVGAARREAGAAMVVAVVMAALVAILVSSIHAAGLLTAKRGKVTVQASHAQAPLDDAGAVYVRALNARFAGEHTDFLIDEQRLQLLVGDEATVLKTADAPIEGTNYATFDPSVPADYRLTVRRRIDGQRNVYGYWQLFAVGLPDFSATGQTGSSLVVYIRSWVANEQNDTVSSARIARMAFRPGRFADYQLVVNGPIDIGSGATVNGPVHSNGAPDRLFASDSNGNDPMIDAKSASCGPNARFSTTAGKISLTGSGGCKNALASANTGIPVNVGALAEVAEWSWLNLCSPTLTGSSPSGRFTWTCVPRGTNPGHVDLGSFLTGDATSGVLVVDGSVTVSGSVPAGQRVTVLAHNRFNAATGEAGGDIHVTADVARGVDASAGLYAGGDVVLEYDANAGSCPVSSVQAALIASSGQPTMPQQYRVPLKLPSDPYVCSSLTLHGSIASHYYPFLAGESGSTTVRGWNSRTLTWDPQLAVAPPPLTPLATPWQIEDYSVANRRCFTGSAPVVATCR